MSLETRLVLALVSGIALVFAVAIGLTIAEAFTTAADTIRLASEGVSR